MNTATILVAAGAFIAFGVIVGSAFISLLALAQCL